MLTERHMVKHLASLVGAGADSSSVYIIIMDIYLCVGMAKNIDQQAYVLALAFLCMCFVFFGFFMCMYIVRQINARATVGDT